jgi:AraC-like DNA-binding protein
MPAYNMQTSVSEAHRSYRETLPPLSSAVTDVVTNRPAPPAVPGAVLPVSNEDLAPLRPILDALGVGAGWRMEGERAPRVLHAPTKCGLSYVGALDQEVPLYHPDGRRYGSLGILPGRNGASDGLKTVLDTVLLLTARSICERWFRLHHRNLWIVAAAPDGDRSNGLLLVLDQRLALQGMDFRARELLRTRGLAAQPARWGDFFRPITPLPSLRGRADVPLRLMGVRDDASWTAVLSPPHFSAGPPWDANALWHARPRCPTDLTIPEPVAALPSLTPGMRRKIEDHIETHLDVSLCVTRLAEMAGLSHSHFSRAFRNTLQMTPHRYVMWRRLLRAQELIKQSDLRLTEIALRTGFSDQSHLCHHFRRMVGQSPARFRRHHR